jgi:hypothetical protein
MATYLVKLTAQNPTRKVEQKFAGCDNEDSARDKALAVFPGAKIKTVELAKEKR